MSVQPAGAFFVLLAVTVSTAEEPQRSDLEEHVEVRETEPPAGDPVAFHTHLELEDVTSRGQDLADVLRRVPGVRVRDYGGLGSYATVSVRASTAEQVTVLVDGVPQNRALGGPVDLSSIPATFVEEIDVYRGFGPAALGLGGVGGVVDVRTRAAGPEPGAQLDLLVGELSTGRLSATLSLPTGASSGFRADAQRSRSTGNFLFLDTSGTYPYASSDDRVHERSNNSLEDSAVQLQHAWDDLGSSRLRLLLRLQERERGVPWIENLATHTAQLDESLHDMTASWMRPGKGFLEETEIVWNAFDQTSHFADPAGDFPTPTDRTTEMQGTSLASVLRASAGRNHLTLRADLRAERASVRDELLEIEDRGGAKRTLIGLAAEDTLTLGRFVLAPSLRWDARRDTFLGAGDGTIPPPAEDVEDSAWSGKLGVARAVTSTTVLRASVGSFYRAPNLQELFGDRGVLRGNPDLRAERGTAGELGVQHHGRHGAADLDLQLVAFGRLTEDMIHFLQKSQGVFVPTNLLETESHGLETSAGMRLPGGWRADVSATWQESIDENTGRPVVYVPEWLGYIGAGFERRGWDLAWDVTYTGENPGDTFDEPALRLPERWIHDAALGYAWRGGFRATLDVNNVFDRMTVDVARYPLPGRVVMVHVGWRHEPRKA